MEKETRLVEQINDEGNRTSQTLLVNGSPTGETINYTWDHRNRLVKAEFRSTPGGTLTKSEVITYDAFDRRVFKQINNDSDATFEVVERYVYDGDDIAMEISSSGVVRKRFLHGPAIDQIFAEENSSGLFWMLADNQGTVRDVINTGVANTVSSSTGLGSAVVNHLTYSAFGRLTSESSTSRTPFATYTGGNYDKDLGLVLLGYRWLDTYSGLWPSQDPIRERAVEVL